MKKESEKQKQNWFEENFTKPLMQTYRNMMYSMQGSFKTTSDFADNRASVMEAYQKEFDRIFLHMFEHFGLMDDELIELYHKPRQKTGFGITIFCYPRERFHVYVPYADERDQNGAAMVFAPDSLQIGDVILKYFPENLTYKTIGMEYVFINKEGFKGNVMMRGENAVTGKFVYTYCPHGVPNKNEGIPDYHHEQVYFND